MVMKNVKNANYLQVDGTVKRIIAEKGIILMSSKEAWQKLLWTRKHFKTKPIYGYFVWIKGETRLPIFTCVTVASQEFKQRLSNLFIVEKGLKIEAGGYCSASKKHLNACHKATGKIVLKEGSTLNYKHIHNWGNDDSVKTDYHFLLYNNAKLNYFYKSISPPKQLDIKTTIDSYKDSTAFVRVLADSSNTKINLDEKLNLLDKGASGVVELRLVGRRKSLIKARSTIVARSFSKGHLDCQGILVDKDAEISLIPELVCKDKNAQITHEASIGKISQEQLSYLRMRGLSEKESIDLIVNGFLNK